MAWRGSVVGQAGTGSGLGARQPPFAPAARKRRRLQHCRVSAGAQPDPFQVLQVQRGSSKAEVRAAYLQRIKLLHPDVNPDTDTTDEAARLNAAYTAILEGLGDGSLDWEEADVFDRPEAEPGMVFVDPFSCFNVSPLQWEQLQAVAREATAAGEDPWEALQRAGAQCSEASVHYLSPAQLEVLEGELQRMSAAMDPLSMEVAGWFVADCLLRARVANNRIYASYSSSGTR